MPSETLIPFFVKKKKKKKICPLHIYISFIAMFISLSKYWAYIYILYWSYSPGVWAGGRQEPPTRCWRALLLIRWSESPPPPLPLGPLLLTGHGWLFCQLWTLEKKYTHHKGSLSGLNEFIGINCFEVIYLMPLLVHRKNLGLIPRARSRSLGS